MQSGTQLVVDDRGTSLPAIEILTGRGFITGKSGSGKSNTANVIVEELLTAGHPLLIIDTDGEYWGLKDTYEILHVGSGQRCDVHVDDAEINTVVDIALDGFPVIFDISEILSGEKATELLADLVHELFQQQKRRKEPLLLVVEEVHEYIPEQGSTNEVGDSLIQIAKRGRKHGLGFCGISQRPAAVDKDFITQCDWIIWHKLTWDNDTDVVRRILGSEEADAIQEFDPGEVFLLTDWDDRVLQTRFKKKRSYDAGATPGFQDPDPPPLIEVPSSIRSQFELSPRSLGHDDDAAAESDASGTDGDGGSDPLAGEATRETGEDSAADADTDAPAGEASVQGTVPVDDPDTAVPDDRSAPTDSTGGNGSNADGANADGANAVGADADAGSPRDADGTRDSEASGGGRESDADRGGRRSASERDTRGPAEDRPGSGRTARAAGAEHQAMSPHPVGNSGIDFVQELSIMLHYLLRRCVATASAGLSRASGALSTALTTVAGTLSPDDADGTDGTGRTDDGTGARDAGAGRRPTSDAAHPGNTGGRAEPDGAEPNGSEPDGADPFDVRQAAALLVIVVAVVLGAVVVLSH